MAQTVVGNTYAFVLYEQKSNNISILPSWTASAYNPWGKFNFSQFALDHQLKGKKLSNTTYSDNLHATKQLRKIFHSVKFKYIRYNIVQISTML